MYNNGTVVTLREAKTHPDGEDDTKLSAGTCGMVVQRSKKDANGNHEYVVDFGPYGQWYCTHNELSGQESVREEEGYDRDQDPYRIPEPVAQLFLNTNDVVESLEKATPAIDFEADLARRMKEIEHGQF